MKAELSQQTRFMIIGKVLLQLKKRKKIPEYL